MKPFRDIQEKNKLLFAGLDTLKPFKEFQEENKLIFSGLDSGLNKIIKDALEPYNLLLKNSFITPSRIESPAITALKSLSEGFAFNYADAFLKRNTELSKLLQSSLLENFNTKNILGNLFF